MVNCPACESDQSTAESLQGVLGDTAQLRCRRCGWWFSLPLNELENDDEID
jgi:hypothetical protein